MDGNPENENMLICKRNNYPARLRGIACLGWMLATSLSMAQHPIDRYGVRWDSRSHDAWGSMPIGNGDIGANLWVDTTGTLSLLISKTDAMSEIGRLLKIGRIDIRFSPNILGQGTFVQELRLRNGIVHIEAVAEGKKLRLECRVDANTPVIRVDGRCDTAVGIEVRNAIWRTKPRPILGKERHSGYGVAFGPDTWMTETDTVLSMPGAIAWAHENKTSIWHLTLENQNIVNYDRIGKDPLLGQRFGAAVGGPGFTVRDGLTLSTERPMRSFSLCVAVRKSAEPSLREWEQQLTSRLQQGLRADAAATRSKHISWWRGFWDRHHIIVTSNTDSATAFTVTQGYLLQRYMNACAGRGGLPIKFNGSIFTTNLPADLAGGEKGFDADFRQWGGNYWFQNTRLPYWTMYMAGDFDLMRPFFDMYLRALPLAKFRTQRYFGHDGAYFTETMTPWGSYLPDNYGWDRKGKSDGVSDNLYIRYYWQAGLELSTMMLAYLDYTGDTAWFASDMASLIREVTTFYDRHYPRDANGMLVIEPTQALETYQIGVANPTPEISGLHHVLDGISRHARLFRDEAFIRRATDFKKQIPALPVAADGSRILPAVRFDSARQNIENPELYAVFPYGVYGLGKPGLYIARRTFAERPQKSWHGWHQDAIQAALLGETAEARRMVADNFSTKHAGSRFPAFWGPNYDWLPDQDHGSVSMLALQRMLVQSDAAGTRFLPAWPRGWNVDFKVHLTGGRIAQGSWDAARGLVWKRRPTGSFDVSTPQ
ncbi:MAG: hypothetical protein EBZ67_06795 [Chitinophagia bacterium]|nr:hypothetical protein [Chitinophagia bacterium]